MVNMIMTGFSFVVFITAVALATALFIFLMVGEYGREMERQAERLAAQDHQNQFIDAFSEFIQSEFDGYIPLDMYTLRLDDRGRRQSIDLNHDFYVSLQDWLNTHHPDKSFSFMLGLLHDFTWSNDRVIDPWDFIDRPAPDAAPSTKIYQQGED